MHQELTHVICNQLSELDEAAKTLLKKYPSNRLFAFYGEMGAGKTTLIKSLCNELKVIDNVSSPTFSIVNVYQSENNDEVFHFDFYRIKSLEEVYDIGYEDYFYSDQYCLIEWPGMVENLLPDGTIKVEIKVNHKDLSRVISF